MNRIQLIHLISSLPRGGRERQLATIYKYNNSSILSTAKIICFNRPVKSYIEEYNMSNDVIFLTSKNPIKRFIQIRKVIKQNEINLIWSWGGLEATFAELLSRFSKVKHINGSIRHGIVRFKVHQLWRLFILHLSKHIVSNSYAGLRANKLTRGRVLYNGLDDFFFLTPKRDFHVICKEFGIKEDTVVLVSIANLVPYKDYNTVLQALRILKEKGVCFHYIAIGEGPDRNKIEEIVEKLSLKEVVSFPGSREDIKDILCSSDICVHSSLGEGCSNAIIEAMASGLPIIASNTGGSGEIVVNTVGRLFEYKNVGQLTLLLGELIENRQLREELGSNAMKRARQEFSVEKMMSNYYKIIEEIAG